jgi:hypothetical protein
MAAVSVAVSAARVGSSAASSRAALPRRARIPEDFFSAQGQALLADLLARRAAAWQRDEKPLYFYGEKSTPQWGEEAGRRWPGRTLRCAKRWALCEHLSLDLERGLRLLALARTDEGKTSDGHTATEWRGALAGVLWRLGQVYRELARREGEAGAQSILRLAMNALWC